MNIALWILQILLAVLYAWHGWLFVAPPPELVEIMNAEFAPWFRIFIGVAEWLAAAGLILPSVTRIMPWLTALAAAGLMIVMSGATVVHLFRGEIGSAISAAPSERAGAASALAETGAELGGALGLAVLGSLGMAVYRSQVAPALPLGLSPEAAQAIQETLGGAVAVAGQLPDQLGIALLGASREAFVLGLQVTSLISTVVMIGLAILTVALLRHIDTDDEPEPQPESMQPVHPATVPVQADCY
jgi:DHA2 family multidrug resistance protein-like MFS transporter